MRQLWLIREDNARLQREMAVARQKCLSLERAAGGGSSSSAPPTQTGQRSPNWNRTLDVMQTELDHCRERQCKIQASYEQRLQALRNQLTEVRSQATTAEAAMVAQTMPNLQHVPGASAGVGTCAREDPVEIARLQASLREARARREALQRECVLAQQNLSASGGASPVTTAAMLSDNTEAKRLANQSQQYKAELISLQEELALVHEREWGTERQQRLRQQVQQLYEDLDEMHQVREDERVRNESEVRELRKERDACRDRLDDAAAELRRLRAKAEALRDLGTTVPGSSMSLGGLSLPPSSGDLAKLREENAGQARELDRLQREEEGRKAIVLELERDQERLVEKIGFISSQAMLLEGGDEEAGGYLKILEAKAADLAKQVDAVESSCAEQRAELAGLRTSTSEALACNEQLQRTYDQLQKSCDERVLHKPLGATALS